jgi:signal peptidase II
VQILQQGNRRQAPGSPPSIIKLYRMQEGFDAGNVIKKPPLIKGVGGLLGVATLVVVLDRITKNYFAGKTPNGTPFPGVFEWTTHQNFGALANIPVPQWVLIAVSIAVIAYIVWLFTSQFFAEGRPTRSPLREHGFAYALILGGAIGNLYDRLAFGYVFDWMMVFHTSIFNIADIAVAVGVVIVGVGVVRRLD